MGRKSSPIIVTSPLSLLFLKKYKSHLHEDIEAFVAAVCNEKIHTHTIKREISGPDNRQAAEVLVKMDKNTDQNSPLYRRPVIRVIVRYGDVFTIGWQVVTVTIPESIAVTIFKDADADPNGVIPKICELPEGMHLNIRNWIFDRFISAWIGYMEPSSNAEICMTLDEMLNATGLLTRPLEDKKLPQ